MDKVSRWFLIVRVAKYPKQNFFCCWGDSHALVELNHWRTLLTNSLRESAFNKSVFDGVTLSAVQTFFIVLNTEFEWFSFCYNNSMYELEMEFSEFIFFTNSF